MACTCKEPQPYTRPSGRLICMQCGARIEPKVEKVVRP